jgi:hypothetical protein
MAGGLVFSFVSMGAAKLLGCGPTTALVTGAGAWIAGFFIVGRVLDKVGYD